MGRPLNKRFFGPLNAGTNPNEDLGNIYTTNPLAETDYNLKGKGYNIPVLSARVLGQSEVTNGTGLAYPYIESQKGSKRYRVRTSATASHVGNCILVNKAAGALDEGEMLLEGYLSGSSGQGPATLIAKLTKHYAIDFNGNRYKWFVEPSTGQDSTEANVLILVSATATSASGGETI